MRNKIYHEENLLNDTLYVNLLMEIVDEYELLHKKHPDTLIIGRDILKQLDSTLEISKDKIYFQGIVVTVALENGIIAVGNRIEIE